MDVILAGVVSLRSIRERVYGEHNSMSGDDEGRMVANAMIRDTRSGWASQWGRGWGSIWERSARSDDGAEG